MGKNPVGQKVNNIQKTNTGVFTFYVNTLRFYGCWKYFFTFGSRFLRYHYSRIVCIVPRQCIKADVNVKL